jgi:hypothetical protein
MRQSATTTGVYPLVPVLNAEGLVLTAFSAPLDQLSSKVSVGDHL